MKKLTLPFLFLALQSWSTTAPECHVVAADQKMATQLGELEKKVWARGLQISQVTQAQIPEVKNFITKMRADVAIDTSKMPLALDSDLLDVNARYKMNYGSFHVITNKEGTIIGTAGLMRTGPNEAEIRKVYLSPEARGGGLGKEVVKELIATAQSYGYTSLRLETYKHLQEAISLYTSLGFEKTSEVVPNEPDVMVFRKTLEAKPASHGLRSAQAKRDYFNRILALFQEHKAELKKILLQVETEKGAEYELRQIEDLLKNVETIEIPNLQRVAPLKNVAVYGSTNIPLYTLMMHAFIPLSVTENVWFRTPKTTRDTYSALFETLAMKMPPGTFSGINILTDARDVQYENFRKLHIMGMNLKGNKYIRDPSEMVVFTGSPETGRQVLRDNVDKLKQMALQTPNKQLFLMFGAGMNPLIVTAEAKNNIKPAVSAAMDSILINSGQDCIAPNFLLVDESVADSVIAELRSRIGQVRVSSTERGDNIITPVAFSETVEPLMEYAKVYRKNLVNADVAKIDPDTKAVMPHLFVFSGKDFKRIPLKEHFAPFLVVFKYKDKAELENMLKDPRVQNKVMYASVFGAPYATDEVSRIVKILQENRHTVSVNDSVYADESGNMAFGGLGPDSSSLTIIESNNGKVRSETAQRPLLFSEEAARSFSPSIRIKASSAVTEMSQNILSGLLKQIDMNPSELPPMLYGWDKLERPLKKNRRTGIQYMQWIAQTQGVFRVLEGTEPEGESSRNKMNAFYGMPIVWTNSVKELSFKKGLGIHVTMPEQGPRLVNKIRGQVNPYLPRGYLTGLLDGNKKLEYFIAEAISPGIMPVTETLATLKSEKVLAEDFEKKRVNLQEKVQTYLSRKTDMNAEEMRSLRLVVADFVQNVFSSVRMKFPQGAYFKNFDDFATADLGIQITTFSSNPAHIAQQFVLRLNHVLKFGKKGDFVSLMAENPYETGSKFVSYLLENPDPVIVQIREEVAKTTQGQNLEFRVDFIDGEPLFSKLRFSREFYPAEAAEAEKVIKDFFAKAPPELRHISGGADVAKLRDGRWIIIEFNFGSSSGTLMPQFFITDSHEAFSRLLGKPTSFIDKLNRIVAGGEARVIPYYRSLQRHLEPWNKYSLEDFSAVEFAKWYRDKILAEWMKRPTAETGQQTLEMLKRVLTSRGEIGEDLQKIIEGAEQFVERTIEKRQEKRLTKKAS